MKTRFCKLFAAVLMCAVLLSAAVGCTDMTNKMTVVLGGDVKKEYIIDLEKIDTEKGLIGVLDYMNSKWDIDYKTSYGDLIKVGGVEYNSAESKYLCVYTSVESDTEKDPLTLDYKGSTYKSVGVDLDDMTIAEGVLIYIGIIRYK